MKSLFVVCPFCEQKIKADPLLRGCRVRCPKCKAVFDPTDQLDKLNSSGTDQLVGCHLGNYRILRKIGEGGMGTVYEAVQGGLERHVALKVLSQKLVDDKPFVQRFQMEARSAAKLDHPNIVQVYEIGQDKGRMYFSMQYVDGESLLQRIQREGPLPLDESLEILGKVIDALDHAYRQGIIHRDIKPDNILLGRDGGVRVADLGLAKSLWEPIHLTNTGAGVGSPHYMAPEQGRGDRNVDCRADIYGLGITLFVMLAGMRPFTGRSALDILMAHINNPLPLVVAMRPELPPTVDVLLARMAAKTPDERPTDYDALRTEIQSFQAKARHRRFATIQSGLDAARRFIFSKPVVLGALGGLLLGGLFLVAAWAAPDPSPRPPTDGSGRPAHSSASPALAQTATGYASADDTRCARVLHAAYSPGRPNGPTPPLTSFRDTTRVAADGNADAAGSPGSATSPRGAVVPRTASFSAEAEIHFIGRSFRFGQPIPQVGALDIDVRYRPCAGDGRIRLVAVEKYPVFSLEIDADGALAAQRWIPRRQTALLLGGRRLPFPTDGRWHSIRLEYGAGHESISLDGRSWRVRAEPHLTTHSYGSFLLNPGRSHADLSIRRLRVQPWFPQAQARLDAGLEQGDFRKAFAQCRSILEFAIDPEIVSWAQETMARRVLPQVIRQDLDASLADARQRRMMASHPEMAEIRVSRATEADDDLPSTPPTFYIDLREVSVEDYASFIRYVERTRDHGKCHPAEPANKDHRPRGLSPTSSQNGSLPVHGVDWFDAYAYASWAGKRLPTMAEWQRAACGDNPAAYPWGRRFDPRKVNLSGRPVPVADLPDGRSPYGCYHMSGNVEEWCADRAVKDGVDQHPVCGGSWVSSSDKAKPSAVTFRPALDREPTFGFRCAQDPE